MYELFEPTDDQNVARFVEFNSQQTYGYETVVIIFNDGTKDLIIVDAGETINAAISHHCHEMDYDEDDIINYYIQK